VADRKFDLVETISNLLKRIEEGRQTLRAQGGIFEEFRSAVERRERAFELWRVSMSAPLPEGEPARGEAERERESLKWETREIAASVRRSSPVRTRSCSLGIARNRSGDHAFSTDGANTSITLNLSPASAININAPLPPTVPALSPTALAITAIGLLALARSAARVFVRCADPTLG
jgi:hypothetical protein